MKNALRQSLALKAVDAQLVASDVPGISVANHSFDAIVSGLRSSLLELAASQRPIALTVPPVISRALLERVGYVDSFPHLLGTIHSYTGTPRRWRELQESRAAHTGQWHDDQEISDLAVLPATCYHVYPMFEGERLGKPLVLTAESYCYRSENTHERGRLRSFRMREFVRISTRDDCLEWRDGWVTRSRDWLTLLGLEVSVEPANDPFFGVAARLVGGSQRKQELKWELKVPVGDAQVQAVASSNYHKEHFGELFNIEIAGETAHTACAAFGLERITLALIDAHGGDVNAWPLSVRDALFKGVLLA